MNRLNEFIVKEIENLVSSSGVDTKYRIPLVGFADANDPLFSELKTIISEEHLLPTDLLTNAKTVVSFFIPFTEDTVRNNLKDDITTKEWAYGKKDTESVIDEIIEVMKMKFSSMQIQCSDNPGKSPYGSTKFMNRWSQRSVAYICGLGTFGLNQLLITKSGCAGRFGSFIIDAETDYNTPVSGEYCLYKSNKSCGSCVSNCPSGALTYDGIDKSKCNQRIENITEKYFNGVKIFGSCGKCIALPCALKNPLGKKKN